MLTDQKMKAVYFNVGGSTEILYFGDIALSDHYNEGQVLVRIKAIGINPIDCKIRTHPERFPVTYPVIPGCDGAGIVEAVGAQVDNFKPGDEVYFSQPAFNNRQGTYAEYVKVDASLLALKPRSLSFEQAAAVPLVFITAWEALHDRAHIAQDHIVLIHAGAGGVGHAAIQLAKLAGAHVIATVSTEAKANFVKRLGADLVINYRSQDVIAEVLRWTNDNGVDIVFDTVGPEILQSCFRCVKPYGDVVTILQSAPDTDWSEARKRNVRFSLELMLTPILLELEDAKRHQGEILRQCAGLFDAHKLQVEIARTFTLRDAAAAQNFLEQNHPIGKLVLIVDS
ncbi:zinc-binding dehydrogenase [Nitrosomonas ureae]|uniref:NADPH2:quinone reductase n=1 Tax=Nitrosomonas ureae TaxID=44577 RepID=A0A1H2E8U9_9PROT|nr:zinc-binding dehydrogenase [Nitrosomonas ureae]SDT91493.1 NADPH2:quinone reductase [Nitrosomonas ureae]